MTKATVAPDVSVEYAWTFPGIPVRIHIRFAVIGQLREILQQRHADAQHQDEIGGLLFGRRRADGIEINGFHVLEPHPGHRRFLSVPQQAKLRSVIDARRGDAIGYFRSDTRGEIRLAEDDLVVIRELFKDPSTVFLIIRAEHETTPTAGFFFWDNGSIYADATFMPFPFDERLLPPSVVKPSVRQIEPSRPTQNLQIHEPKRSTKRVHPLTLGFVLLVAIACCVTVYLVLRPKPLGAPPQNTMTIARPAVLAPLSLFASHAGKQIVITWDSQARAAMSARVGVLTIKDGDSQSELPLTKSQLQISTFIYAYRSNRIDISLEVFPLEGTPTRDSIIVAVGDGKKASLSPATLATAHRQSEGVAASVEQPLKSNTNFRVIPPSTQPTTKEIEDIIDAPPPPVIEQPNSARLNAPEFLATPPTPITAAAPLSATKSPEASPTLSVHPPEIIRQFSPVIPPNVLAMVKRRIDVRVRVRVNKDGKVVGSELLTPLPGAARYLGTATVNAVRYWTFKPARRGQFPVESELVVRFTFGS